MSLGLGWAACLGESMLQLRKLLACYNGASPDCITLVVVSDAGIQQDVYVDNTTLIVHTLPATLAPPEPSSTHRCECSRAEKLAPARNTRDICEKRKSDAHASFFFFLNQPHKLLNDFCPDSKCELRRASRESTSRIRRRLSHESGGRDCHHKGLIEVMSRISQNSAPTLRKSANSFKAALSQERRQPCRFSPRSSSNNLVQELHPWNLWISSRHGALTVDELDLRHLHLGLDPSE